MSNFGIYLLRCSLLLKTIFEPVKDRVLDRVAGSTALNY